MPIAIMDTIATIGLTLIYFVTGLEDSIYWSPYVMFSIGVHFGLLAQVFLDYMRWDLYVFIWKTDYVMRLEIKKAVNEAQQAELSEEDIKKKIRNLMNDTSTREDLVKAVTIKVNKEQKDKEESEDED